MAAFGARMMGRITRLHQAIRPQHAARAHELEATDPRPTATAARSPLVALQQSIGNRAVGRLVQAKLEVGRPGDRFEREADRVADQVTRMPAPRLQRACACGGDCPRCQAEQTDRNHPRFRTGLPRPGRFEQEADRAAVMRMPDSTAGIQHIGSECEVESHQRRASEAGALGSDFRHPQGGGRPLPEAERDFFEPRFGQDFSEVRIHTDAKAGKAARSVGALAYTMGSDIVFGQGEFQPGTGGGKRLLAHELTHVVQQDAAATVSLHRQPFEEPSQLLAGPTCPIATSSPAFVDTHVDFLPGSSTPTFTAIADIVSFVERWNAAGADEPVRVDGYTQDSVAYDPWSLSCDQAMSVKRALTTPPLGPPGVPVKFIEVFVQSGFAPNPGVTIAADIPSRLPASPGPPGRRPGAAVNACQHCPFFCGYDTSKDRFKYNCSGLAFRTYNWHDLSETKSVLANGSGSSCGTPCKQPGMIKFWLWEYDGRLEDSRGRLLQSFDPDFHIVAGPTGGDARSPKDSDAFYSKNNRRPVHGPGTAASFRPPAKEQELDLDDKPVFDHYWVRFNIKESCYCFPCPKDLDHAKW